MEKLVFLVLFKVILLNSVCIAYDVYEPENGDLLKGVLLGALLATQKNAHNVVNYVPLPYFHNLLMSSAHNSYPTNNPIEQEYRESNYHMNSEEMDSLTEDSETMSEVIPTDIPTTSTTLSPVDSLHKQLGLPPNTVIVMMMPSNLAHGRQLVFNKQPEDLIEQNGHTVEQMEITLGKGLNNSDDLINLRTNAIKVGTKHLNPKGWKPVPKLKTTTASPVRKNRYNTRPYIQKSQFGLRTLQ